MATRLEGVQSVDGGMVRNLAGQVPVQGASQPASRIQPQAEIRNPRPPISRPNLTCRPNNGSGTNQDVECGWGEVSKFACTAALLLLAEKALFLHRKLFTARASPR
jgi:hypothetical protein